MKTMLSFAGKFFVSMFLIVFPIVAVIAIADNYVDFDDEKQCYHMDAENNAVSVDSEIYFYDDMGTYLRFDSDTPDHVVENAKIMSEDDRPMYWWCAE